MKNKYLELIKNNPVVIGHWLGFTDLTDLHNEWIKKFLFNKEDMTLQGHRGSYKTTCLSIAIALHMVIYFRKNIIFMRKTDSDVQEIIKQVNKILSSDIFQYLTKQIYGQSVVLTSCNSTEITTSLFDSTKGTAQLLGLGTKASMTGKHADLVITDDIVNKEDRTSRAERNRTKSVYMELQNIKNRGGRILNTGTPWHKEDAFTLMPEPLKYDCYSTGLISNEDLEKLKSSMTKSLFSANYELRHIPNDKVMFSNPKMADEDNLMYGLAHVDASFGGEDSSALTILKKFVDKDGKIRYIVFGKKYDKHIDVCMHDILEHLKKYICTNLFIETNADKGYVAKQFRLQGVRVTEYHESTNKFVKISTHLKGVWDNVYFHKDTDKDYILQIEDYNEDADHDDCSDSLASLIRECEQTIRRGF